MELPSKASDDKKTRSKHQMQSDVWQFCFGFFFFLQYDLRPISMTRSSRSGLWFSILYFVLIFSCGSRAYTATHV